MTTFITPCGHYRFKCLPYSISLVPEYFQKKMDNILHGLQGVVCHIDDILIFGKDKQEHDARLKKVLDSLSQSSLTLDPEKFASSKKLLSRTSRSQQDGGQYCKVSVVVAGTFT